MTKRASSVAVVLLIAAVAVSGAGPRPSAPAMGGVVLRTLPNGLRVIVREQHGAPLVAIDLWVRAGSGCEGSQESGAAHFLEHLLFKGTPTRKPGEIDAAIEDLGATLSAGTTRDAAHFYTTVASQHLSGALDVLSDAIMHPLLAPEQVERERAVILDELARGRNDWRKQVLDGLFAALYAGRPYGRPVVGLVESLKTLSRDSVAGFYRRHYAPNNATLVLVGDVTADSAEAAALKAFGAWPKREVVLPLDSLAPTYAPAAVQLPADDTTAVVAFGYRAPPGTDVESVCAAGVVKQILGGPRGGRLQAALKAICGPDDVHADFEELRDPTLITIYAAVDARRLDQARSLLDSEMKRLKSEGVTPDEVAFARRRLLGSYLYDTEIYAGQARLLGAHDMIGDYTLAISYASDLAKVTATSLAAFVDRYLMPQNRVELTIRPAEAK